jgi:hypothetical protein
LPASNKLNVGVNMLEMSKLKYLAFLLSSIIFIGCSDKQDLINSEKYFKQEMSIFIWATISLVGGNFGQLVIPYYIGAFVDIMNKGEFD